MAEALAHLHEERGWVHRDVSTSNVLLTPDAADPRRFRAKLSDFGLSTALAGGATHRTSQLRGTLDFMPPGGQRAGLGGEGRGGWPGAGSRLAALRLRRLHAAAGPALPPPPPLPWVAAHVPAAPAFHALSVTSTAEIFTCGEVRYAVDVYALGILSECAAALLPLGPAGAAGRTGLLGITTPFTPLPARSLLDVGGGEPVQRGPLPGGGAQAGGGAPPAAPAAAARHAASAAPPRLGLLPLGPQAAVSAGLGCNGGVGAAVVHLLRAAAAA